MVEPELDVVDDFIAEGAEWLAPPYAPAATALVPSEGLPLPLSAAYQRQFAIGGEQVYQLLPADKADDMCQPWQSCSNLRDNVVHHADADDTDQGARGWSLYRA